jgi:hypothetical protein
MSNGANGRPTVFQPQYQTATSAVVSSAPVSAPYRGVV